MSIKYIDDVLEENVKTGYCVSYEAQKKYHDAMLAGIARDARRSKAYAGRLPGDVSIGRLSEIPMTCPEDVESAIGGYGLENVLLSKPVKHWQTSGYTGTPKKFYYGAGDVERMHFYILEMLFLTGVFESDAEILNLGESDPYLPGTLFDECFRKYGDRAAVNAWYSSCPVTDEQGFIKGLRMISKAEGVNVLLSFPIVYYLVAMAAERPEWLDHKVSETISRLYFLPFRIMPKAVSGALARIYLRDVNVGHIKEVLRGIRIGFAYGEHTGPYKAYIDRHYPSIRLHSVLGSTEMLVQAFHLSGGDDDMSVPLKHYIPEIALPEDVEDAKSDPGRKLNATPWYRWEKGMKGELIITRPGECLPLIRYPTGDLIEVVDPARTDTVVVRGNEFDITLPVIRVLGRVVDTVDFDAPGQSGTFFGYKFHARDVDDALRRAGNIRWWELYRLHGSPGRLMLWVIPEAPVHDVNRFQKAMIASLMKAHESQSVPFGLANDLNVLDVVISKPEAYVEVEKGIERRVREGRPLGRIKPRHVHKLEDETEYENILEEKKRWAA